jgi:nucleotide-binding universal stress UspA family protein
MYTRILVPLENSRTDDAIVAHVRTLARHCSASLVLIHVADGFAARNMNALELRESEEIKKDRAYLDAVTARLVADGFTVEAVLASGDPAKEITAAAQREHCDLIAMSTHGHRFFSDLFYGSVAESLRHRCMIPILLVRGSKTGKTGEHGVVS